MDAMLERQRAAVAEHFALENAHDWPKVVATFTAPNPVFELVPAGAKMSGHEGIAGAYHILDTALPDVRITVVKGSDVPGYSVREILITGKHTGDYFGVPGGGRKVKIEMACFFEFDAAGRLITERVYFDNARLIAQMRGELTLAD